jgi:uncharacterized protein (DUF433 family)
MINEDRPMDRRGGRLFSPAEAAALTELPLKAVNNAIDKEIVPAAARRTRRELAGAIRRLRQIRATVDSNPAVVGGEPVFRGTRIQIHLAASLLVDGVTEEQLKESYPRLTRQLIRLAPLYAAAYPLRGRPRQSTLSAIPPKRIVRTPLPPTKS